MRKVLSKKECLFLIELKELLLKYTVSFNTTEKQSIHVLLFDKDMPKYVEDPIPIEFSDWLDESDINELFEENKEVIRLVLEDLSDESYVDA